jgi:hypothetical protein
VERLRARGVKNDEIRVILMGGPGKDRSSTTNQGVLQGLLRGILVLGIGNLRGKNRILSWKRGATLSVERVLNRLI